ncbi:MAG: mannose-1-phosphate guanylyltransferase [Planctomycetota bacterium]
MQESLPDLPLENILTEPCARNTLACIALATYALQRRDPNSVQLVLPADHVIEPAESFHASVKAAVRVAIERESLVTFGIRPTFPATGYGYIELGKQAADSLSESVFDVVQFQEKPSLEVAKEFVDSGRFLWNSGMFVWTTQTIANSIAKHSPDIHEALSTCEADALTEVYAGLRSAPIDKGVMEKASNRNVLPIDYRWSDVGSWSALEEVLPAKKAGMIESGSVELITHDSQDCIVHASEKHTIALVGVKDLIVVHTDGATLVCPRDRDQDVREIVEQLKARASDRA